MKRFTLVYFLLALSLCMVSCSKDNDSATEANNLLPSKLIFKEYDYLGGVISYNKYEFFYEGNKIKKIKKGYGVYTFYYSNSKLQRFERGIKNPTSPYSISSFAELQYNDGNELIRYFLHREVNHGDQLINRIDLKYNNNQVLRDIYFLNEKYDSDFHYSSSDNLTYNSNNIQTYRFQGVNFPYTYDFTYDTKNSVFKNVFGLKELGIITTGNAKTNVFEPYFYLFASENNIKKRSEIFVNNGNETVRVVKFKTDFNLYNMPKKIKLYIDHLNDGSFELVMDCEIQY